ncbi:MAG: OmpH family outer membrane protein [Spirochaetaceae bacterium]|jgi:outer membrane protein|nr:OmpH family outer membrane protein [Spirochaetaceae bacterium]
MKRLYYVLLLGLLQVVALSAQQITRFAVIDLARIYVAFQTDSKAVRDWEERSAKIQHEIDKRTEEIQNLKRRQADAAANNNESEARKLEVEVTKKTDSLKIYFETEKRKLEEQKPKIPENSDFLNKVYNAARVVAESEGYSMVLNLRDNKGIFWYSQAIDITDKVIANLKSKVTR